MIGIEFEENDDSKCSVSGIQSSFLISVQIISFVEVHFVFLSLHNRLSSASTSTTPAVISPRVATSRASASSATSAVPVLFLHLFHQAT